MKDQYLLLLVVAMILTSCGMNIDEQGNKVHHNEEQKKQAIISGAQLMKLNEKRNEFIHYLANSETFDSTYSLQSRHYLLFDVHNRRPLDLGYDNYSVKAFIDIVGSDEHEYVQNQVESMNSFRLDISKKGNAIVVPYDSLAPALTERGGISWEEYYKHFDGWFYFISIPLFSRNGNYALVEHGYHCGLMCGGGYAEIYERTSTNGWKRIKVVSEWQA